jgi:hypothetical protein
MIPFGLPTIVAGDLNIDLLKQQTSSEQLLKLFQYHGLFQHVQIPTHRKGGLLDHIYSNLKPEAVDVIPTYYSDYFLISMAVPLQNLKY